MNDDPFALDGDDDRTVLRPRGDGPARSPGGARGRDSPPAARRDAGRAVANDPAARAAPLLGGINPLERAASRLLPLLVSIRQSREEPDVGLLRERLVRELESFNRRARETLEDPKQAVQSSYVLCTALDEAVMQTPWGHRANWSQHSLLETFHDEVAGGTRFFSLLKELGRDPERNRPVLELMYIVLALGFEGSYRLARDGQSTLARIREWLHGTLAGVRDRPARALSPHWEGSAVGERRLPRFAAASLAALLAVGVGAAIWVGMRIDVAARTETAVGRIVPLAAAPFTARRVAPPPPPAPEPDAPPRPTLAQLLAPDVAADAVVVEDDGEVGRVRIVGDALFGSGRADVAESVEPLLARVARALGRFDGEITVTGHTDGVPIRSGRFASNLELSLARAEAVRDALVRSLPPGRTARAEGRGSLERLTDDSTPELRRRNRRVDVTLEYR